MLKTKTTQNNKKRYIYLALAVILLIFLAAWAFHIGPFHKSKVAVTGGQFTKGEPANSQTVTKQPSSTANNSSPVVNDKSTGTAQSSTVLLAPTGSLVSNHHPSLSGATDQKTISSVCSSTPGASCTISFTKDGVTKSLPTYKIDQGGSAYWNNWAVQDYLSPGTWTISVSATLNGQTKSGSDAQDMVVSP